MEFRGTVGEVLGFKVVVIIMAVISILGIALAIIVRAISIFILVILLM